MYRAFLPILLVLALTVPRLAAADPPTAQLPFAVEWEEAIPEKSLPAIQSFCVGSLNANWLVFGGRVAGLHTFEDGKNNFPRESANTKMYVIDPTSAKVVGQFDVTKLGAQLAGPLSATNLQWVQDGDVVYVIGGYGLDLSDPLGKKMISFDTVIRIQANRVGQLIADGELDASKFLPFFKIAHDPRLKVTGGELKKIGDTFFLIFGQSFDGEYSVGTDRYNHQFGQQQKYTQKVRCFSLDADLSVTKYATYDGGYDASLPYNRRDLNAVDVVRSDGVTPAIQVYGGVFKAGQVAGHTNPIEIDAIHGVSVKWVKTYDQALSHYECAHFTVYDPASKAVFTTFFGGISQYYFNRAANKLRRDRVDLTPPNIVDGLPFIKTASVLQRSADGAYSQFVLPQDLPGFIGAEGRFVADAGAKPLPNGVLSLSNFNRRTLAGYFYGGIESNQPYGSWPSGKTNASSRLLRIWITPGQSTVLAVPLPLPEPEALNAPR